MASLTAHRAPPDSPEAEPLLDQAARGDEIHHDSSMVSDATLGADEHKDETIALRIAAAAWSFVVVGLFTSTTGVVIPHLEEHYKLTDIQVSAIFLVMPIGYIIASWRNDFIHNKFGQRGIATIGPLCHLVYAATASFRPPFPVFLLAAAIGAFGIGLIDGSWCAWVAALRQANTLSGLLHGSFSTGAAICPYLVGIMLSESGSLWYRWFYVLSFASAIEIVVLLFAFRHEDSEKYHKSKLHQDIATGQATKGAIFKYSATWTYATYLLVYVGAECTISGWIVAFMLRVRHASTYASSLCSSAFWAGMAAGRLMLGLVTDKLGVRRAVVIYLLFAPAFVVLFIVIRVLWFSVFSMALLGFFMGPLFPSSIVQLVELLPKELHVASVSFVASLGQVGGALLPYMLGAITQLVGLQVFQYMLLVQFAILLVIWIASFRLSAKKEFAEDDIRSHQD
ncbi:major facilitator superfamily transporter [Colletotrichum truncatum]|uniref:Major facilitator superfamily transporter n=1 Tax=Colletotrichum truncatum TaxID=5467 RepID=A0ACC3YUR5_COLTU|nr:major facilitator superfamily transporter [Colletotrichum truncatum]KAF6780751.1 major facilitator superfamily transporter [Colletotrichum truncatum]